MEKVIKIELIYFLEIIKKNYLIIILIYILIYTALAVPLYYMRPLNTFRLERVVAFNDQTSNDLVSMISAKISLQDKPEFIKHACGDSYDAKIKDYPLHKPYKVLTIEAISDSSNCMEAFAEYVKSELLSEIKKYKNQIISEIDLLNIQKKQLIFLFKNPEYLNISFDPLVNLQLQIYSLENKLNQINSISEINIISEKYTDINIGYRYRYLFINLICLIIIFISFILKIIYNQNKKN